ncbi:MAG: Wzz/FepE/Etk N-terminal domain-containing protein, partial [Methanococcaceae archaeon]
MAESKNFDILDFFVLLLRRKRFLAALVILTFVLSYTAVYYLIPAEYDSTALIVPAADTQMGGISSIVKNLKDIPLGLGGSSKSGETDMLVTIINSRSTLEKLINKYNLKKDYNTASLEEALKILNKKISTEVTEEKAFKITVRTFSPRKSADIVNDLLKILNESVITLNVAKSKNNREFLEKRYDEIKRNLKSAEDSLQLYQVKSGLLEAKEQSKLIMSAYTKLEGDVMVKQLEYSIMEKLQSKDAPQLNNLRVQLDQYKQEFNKFKQQGGGDQVLLPVSSLPEKTKNYVRYLRNVEVYNTILEFVVPLYEQAKFEEQKDIPVLQVIDYGAIPEKKAAPPRSLIAGVIAML